jgi:hypothetical protein
MMKGDGRSQVELPAAIPHRNLFASVRLSGSCDEILAWSWSGLGNHRRT